MIQRFLKPGARSPLAVERTAELLYMCKVEGNQAALPRTMHRHDDCTEIVFICEGQGTHIIGGREYRTRGGDLLIYNSGTLHDESASTEAHMIAYCCGFRGLKLRGLPANHLVPEQGCPVLASGEQHAALASLFELLYDQVGVAQSGAAETCHHLLQALILLVGRLLERPEPRLDAPGYDLGREVQHYLDERYAEALDLQVIAQRFKVSPYHLAHRFKAAIGCSPIHYLIRRRIGEAQSLLINTELSVTEIAERVGYRRPSYFTTAFKRVVGMTPGRYRRCYLSG